MSREEHYFENLIHCGSDECARNCNRDTISKEAKDIIEMCYTYICYELFAGREDLDEYLKERQ